MIDFFKMTRMFEPALVIPVVISGILFIIGGISYLIKYFKKIESKHVRNTGLAGVLMLITGALLLSCNVVLMFLPILIYLIVPRFRKEKNTDEEDKRSICFPWFYKKTKKRIICNIMVIVLMLTVIFPYFTAGYTYQSFFGKRYETADYIKMSVSDFDGLQCENITFKNDRGDNLAGYLYYYDDGEPKRGVVVLGHGYGGGGQNGYMPVINYFAKHGYYGFAYDATGNDNSESYGIIGLPQQISDMDKAIDFVENEERTKSLPVVLWGHSWGGYTATNVLAFHPEVKAVAVNAGFNYSLDLIKSWGPKYVGPFTDYFIPYMKVHEKIQCGKLSDAKAEDGFASSDAKIMVIAAPNDRVVSVKYGFDMWKDTHGDDPRFTFISRVGFSDDRAHGYVYCSKDYLDWKENKLEPDFYKWLESLDYDYEKEQDRYNQDRIEYFQRSEVKIANVNQLDEELFGQILDFYDEAIK